MTLPKLPLPALSQTLKKYEKTMQPLLDETEKKRLKDLIKKFGEPSGIGVQLQLYLQNRQDKLNNWAYEYWLNDMYLGNPAPVLITSNPGNLMPPRQFKTKSDMTRFAAKIINAGLHFQKILNQHTLPIEQTPSLEPLCMAQYYQLLGGCRLPGKYVDSQYITVNLNSEMSNHVIVIHRNRFYYVPIESFPSKCNEDKLSTQLLEILNNTLVNAPPLGLLTGWSRKNWWKAREHLKESEQNKKNLKLIEKSLLIICLDQPLPSPFNTKSNRGGQGHKVGVRDETNMLLQMMHGGGSDYNSANRWFDKTVQFIVSEDGACGVCNEHSMSEGVAIAQLIEKFEEYINNMPNNAYVTTEFSNIPLPECLEWSLTSEDLENIEKAKFDVDNLIESLDFSVFRYEAYGKKFIKNCRVSPDVFIQLALQLTFYKLNGKLTATYETASTRRFHLGRVDCIRSATPEALQWVIGVTNLEKIINISNKYEACLQKEKTEIINLWNLAVKAQTKEMLDTVTGQGIDVHLLGLREAAKCTMIQIPELFTDKTYQIANSFLLSTSQVAVKSDIVIGYGPVHHDGYGVWYSIKENTIVFGISAYCSSEITSVVKFIELLEESLDSIRNFIFDPYSDTKCNGHA